MPGAGESKTSPRRSDAAQRRGQALKMRLAGATFDQIARAPRSKDDPRPMYSSRKRAHEAVTSALDELARDTKGTAEELRTLELARLDAMQRSLWPSTLPHVAVTCEGCGHTMWREPDKEAVDRVIKIIAQRAKFTGIEVKGVEQDHGAAGSMIGKILDAMEAGFSADELEMPRTAGVGDGSADE